MAVTKRDDDYLICKHYYNHINDTNADYPEFITFEHNNNHYFAWVRDGKVILRSEAYPDYERTIRGIKAIIKNRDIHERYSIDSAHGAHFLVLWGGGNHQKHTGNMESHNEIGRSCPAKSKDELLAMMGFMGPVFASSVFAGVGNVKGAAKKSHAGVAAAATAGAAALASTTREQSRSGYTAAKKSTAAATTKTTGAAAGRSGFNWMWLLPLLLIPLFFLWKGCGGDKVSSVPTDTVDPIEKAEIKADLNEEAVTTIDNDKEADDKIKADALEAKLAAEREAESRRVKAEADKRAKAAREAQADAAKKKADEAGSINNTVNYIGNKSSGF